MARSRCSFSTLIRYEAAPTSASAGGLAVPPGVPSSPSAQPPLPPPPRPPGPRRHAPPPAPAAAAPPSPPRNEIPCLPPAGLCVRVPTSAASAIGRAGPGPVIPARPVRVAAAAVIIVAAHRSRLGGSAGRRVTVAHWASLSEPGCQWPQESRCPVYRDHGPGAAFNLKFLCIRVRVPLAKGRPLPGSAPVGTRLGDRSWASLRHTTVGTTWQA
jgi:hypothetical protein